MKPLTSRNSVTWRVFFPAPEAVRGKWASLKFDNSNRKSGEWSDKSCATSAPLVLNLQRRYRRQGTKRRQTTVAHIIATMRLHAHPQTAHLCDNGASKAHASNQLPPTNQLGATGRCTNGRYPPSHRRIDSPQLRKRRDFPRLRLRTQS